MKLFESEQEKADRLIEDAIYVKVKFSFSEIVDFKKKFFDYYSNEYYDEEHDCSQEKYIKNKLKNISNEDIVNIFQNEYINKEEMIQEFMSTYLDEDDMQLEVNLDNEEEEDDEDSLGEIDEIDEEDEEDSLDLALNSITSKIRDVA